MATYVDDVRLPFRRMIMCHMWADDVDELHAMADRIGLARKWFQCPPDASWEHYDISLSLKDKALSFGAILTDKYAPALHHHRLQLLRAWRKGVSANSLAIFLDAILRVQRARERHQKGDPMEQATWLDFIRRHPLTQ